MTEFKEEFDRLRALGSAKFQLRGTTLLVEMLPQEELKTKGGLVLATMSDQPRGGVNANKLECAVVHLVGQGTWDDEKREYVPLDVTPGSVVVMPQYSQQMLSTWPGLQRPLNNKLAIVASSSILGFYPSIEAYNEATKEINK